jgi:aminopeptidase N
VAVAAAACSSTDSGVTARNADAVVSLTAPASSQPPTTDASAFPDTTTPRPAEPAPESTNPAQPNNVDPDGLGDSLYPALGNPGYDVTHYDVDIGYDTDTQILDASVGIDLVPTEVRDEFKLDATFTGTESVTVDGAAAQFVEDSPELRITLDDEWEVGTTTRVEILYSITPTLLEGDGGFPLGWFDTDGGSYVLNEPDGARSWLPSNDHPADKATFRFVIRTPPGVTGVANGDLVEHTTDSAGEVWVWDNPDPTTTYLLQVLTGDYEVIEGVGPNDLPLLSVVLREDVALMQPFIDTMSAQIDYFDDFFGPYPLSRYGLAITDSFGGLAMETTGRSLFSREDFIGGTVGYVQDLLLAHELAHQWFGDAVSPARWQDIWLNESFATYAQWMWLAGQGYQTLDDQATQALEFRDLRPTAEPTASDLFGYNSYDGGAVVLHALRGTVGDDAFFELLRTWVSENSGSSRTTEDFMALAERVSAADLTGFFDTWLFAATVPQTFPAAGASS